MEKTPVTDDKLVRLNRLYAVLSETSLALVQADTPDAVYHDFCRIAVMKGDFSLAWVGLLNEETGLVDVVASHGKTRYLADLKISAREEPEGLGPTGIAVREGTSCICNEFQQDPRTKRWHDRAEEHGLKSSASIAIKRNGCVIGALTLYAGEAHFFDPQMVELLRQMGAAISFTMDKFELAARTRAAEHALQAETAERLRAVEELREKEQMLMQQSRQAAMGEMIGNIAHQWRQPLNTLGLMIQELPLVHESGDLTDEFLEESVEKTMEIIRHMSETIDDFRNFFKPDKEKVAFNVLKVITKTLSLVRGSFNEKEIRVRISNSADPVITGYPNEYSQVLLNILINARDAVTPQVESPEVTIDVSEQRGKAVVTISDNAGGIPEADLQKIFEPYFTTKGPDKGTGVGLFMAKTIIERNMNGRLSARNTGNGAEFRIEV